VGAFQLHRFLNLHPAEMPRALSLFWVQLFSGIGLAFLYVLSTTWLLSTMSYEVLIYGFILSGGIVLLAQQVYNYFEHHFGLHRVMKKVLIFSGLLSLSMYFWTMTNQATGVYLTCFATYYLLYYLNNTAFWGIAALSFDIRESKRVFNIIGSGDIPSKMLGYGLVAIFAGKLPLETFLLVGLLSFGVAVLFMRRHERQFGRTEVVSSEESAQDGLQVLIQETLVRKIGLLALIFSLAFTVIDYTFLTRVKYAFKDNQDLATFLALFFAISRIVALLLKLIFSSRLQRRLGTSNMLFLLPGIIITFSLISVFFQELLNPGVKLFSFGILVVFAELFKSAIYEPYYFTLFQPLRRTLRLKGHNLAKGVMIPLGQVIAGLLLIAILYYFRNTQITAVSFVLIAVCAYWIWSIRQAENHYFRTIQQSLVQNQFFRLSASNLLENAEVRNVLFQKISNGNASEAQISLSYLKEQDKVVFQEKLHELLRFDERPEVLVFAIQNISGKADKHQLVHLLKILEMSEEAKLKRAILAYLSAQDSFWLEKVQTFIKNDTEMVWSLKGALCSGDLNSIINGGNILLGWLSSSDLDKRARGIQVIAEAAQPILLRQLIPFLDNTLGVEKVLISAAQVYVDPQFIPFLAKMYLSENFEHSGKSALLQYSKLFNSHCSDFEKHLGLEKWIKLLSQSESIEAIICLREYLGQKGILSNQMIGAFYRLDAAIPDIAVLEKKKAELNQEIKQIYSWLIQCNHPKMFAALENECLERLLIMIELLHIQQPDSNLKLIHQIIKQSRKTRYPQAIEMLEKINRSAHESALIRWAESILMQKYHIVPDHNIYTDILKNNDFSLKSWTIAVALYISETVPARSVVERYKAPVVEEIIKLKHAQLC
jgi:ATP/ADP translocase